MAAASPEVATSADSYPDVLHVEHMFINSANVQDVVARMSQQRIRRLFFTDCFFDPETPRTIADALRQNGGELLSFGMGDCVFAGDASDLILDAVGECRKTEWMQVDSTFLSTEAVGALAATMRKLKALKHLHITKCVISDDEAEVLAKAIPRCFSLRLLYMGGLQLSDDGFNAMIGAIANSVSLQEVPYFHTSVSLFHREQLRLAISYKPPSHILVGLTLLRAGTKGCGAICSGKGLTQDERELILRLLEPWFGIYDTEKAARCRAASGY